MKGNRTGRGAFKSGFDPRRNLNGQPKKGTSLAEKIRNALNEEVHEGYTKLDALIDEAMEQAKAGNFQMWEALMARGFGKVPDRIEINKEQKLDLSKLSDDELAEFEKLQKKAAGEDS